MKDRVGDLAPESSQSSTSNEPDLRHAMSEGVNEGRLLLLVGRFSDLQRTSLRLPILKSAPGLASY